MGKNEIKIAEIKNKDVWEDFLSECREKTFLNSWNWGEFQSRMGNKIWRLGTYASQQGLGVSQQLLATTLITRIRARRGTFLLIQHGPDINPKSKIQNQELLEVLLAEFKKIGKEEGAAFIRMNPLWPRSKENKEIFKKLGLRESPMHANAYEATWKLDIRAPEEELLGNMRKTTRYLIRQAIKNPDIAIEKSDRIEDLKTYQSLNQEVAKRQKFTPFPFNYVKNEFEIFSKDNQVLWLFGKYKNEITASALVIFWSNTAFYHQAASSSKYAKFPVPYLLLWEAIKEAKKRGCKIYDFWGYVDPKKEFSHPWAGPTLFKMGFGGSAFEYLKTQDLPLSKKYWLIYFFEKLRKIKKGL